MFTIAERLASAVLHNGSETRCLTCLSLQIGVSEKDAREASQLLALRHEFGIAARTCRICGRIDDLLVTRKAAA